MKTFNLILVGVFVVLFSSHSFAEKPGAGLSTITKEYHRLSTMVQGCSLLYREHAASYRKYFSSWLIRNRVALEKGKIKSKQLSAKRGVRLKQSIKEYKLFEKEKFNDSEKIKENKTCGYLPSYMAD